MMIATLLTSCARRSPRRSAPAAAIAAAITALLLTTGCAAAQPPGGRIHGPILQWSHDPTSTMTILWVERFIAPLGELNTWNLGPGGFGYDAQATRTELHNMRGAYTGISLRREVELEGLSPDGTLIVEALYDDAFIMWLNGTEILRVGVEGEAVAARDIQSHEAGELEAFIIDDWRILLRPDDANILAVEGHNVDLNSSDFSMVLRVVHRVGDEQQVLVPPDADWQYYIGGWPAEGWQTKLLDIPPEEVEEIDPRAYWDAAPLRYRRADADDDHAEDDSDEESWLHAQVHTRFFADTTSLVRQVTLEALEPGARYEFALPGGTGILPGGTGILPGGTGILPVRDNTNPDDPNIQPIEDIFTFQTAPATLPETLTFVTGGDMYHRRDWVDAMNRRCGAQDPLFALLGGDLAYADGRSENRWYEWLDSWAEHARGDDDRMIPMIVAIGNHETGSGYSPQEAAALNVHPHAKFFYSLFDLPQGMSSYAIDFSDYLSVIVLDSDHTQPVAAQTAWLADALASRAQQRYVFATYHKPAYGTGVKDDNLAIQREWSPLFEQFGVDAVFENDHHVYKRTHPIRSGSVDPERGVPYLGDGAWGVGTREIPPLQTRPHIAHAESVRHLIRVDLEDGRRTYTAITADDREIDRWEDARPRDARREE